MAEYLDEDFIEQDDEKAVPRDLNSYAHHVRQTVYSAKYRNAPHAMQFSDEAALSQERADTSCKRPGTPAVMQNIFDEVYDESNALNATDDEQGLVSNRGRHLPLSSRHMQESKPTEICQPYFHTPVTLSFEEKSNRSPASYSLEHSSPDSCRKSLYISHNRNVQQDLGEHNSYQLHTTPDVHAFEPLFGTKQNPLLLNYNVNSYRQNTLNMVRLNEEGTSDSKDEASRSISKTQFLEDDEGNHECRPLVGHKISESNNEYHSGAASMHNVIDTSTNRSTDHLGMNHLAALGASLYQEEWPLNKALWMSGPSSIGEKDSLSGLVADDTESIMSFSSSSVNNRHTYSHQLGAKVEMVYSLLSMLGSSSRDDMCKTLLEMSNNRESCIAMRQSGCLPLLVQLLHGTEHDYNITDQDPNAIRWALRDARRKAGQALHNIVYAHPDDKRGRREARVLRLLEQIRDYSDYLKEIALRTADISHNENLDLHPGPAIAALMKLSFDEEHRHAMCLLGGLQAIAELIQVDHEIHGNTNDQFCITVRRYAGMALTNLTFGDGTNKALLCSMKQFMQALVAQLQSPSEDLRQVAYARFQ